MRNLEVAQGTRPNNNNCEKALRILKLRYRCCRIYKCFQDRYLLPCAIRLLNLHDKRKYNWPASDGKEKILPQRGFNL